MDRGYILYAKGDDYINQAVLCAMSLKASKNSFPISLITNDSIDKEYIKLFDKIIPIPWDSYDDTRYQVNNRWKVYYASPYNYTIVLDTDTLILQNLDSWWDFFNSYEMFFPVSACTYRGEIISSNYYRKAFVANLLPNVYSTFYYFHKGDLANNFFSWLERLSANWELFYGQFCKEYYPEIPSMDISVSIVSKILDIDKIITNNKVNLFNFTHMKPMVQNWKEPKQSWQKQVGTYLTKDLKLLIGNYMQAGIFHYVENNFVSDKIIKQYKDFLKI